MHTGGISGIFAGLNVFVAVTLMVAALLKSVDIQSVERLLVDTLPPRIWRVRGVDSRRIGRAAAGVEAVGGIGLLLAPRGVYPVVSVVLVIPMLVILAVAVRAAMRKVPCGCFGGSRRKAGLFEVGRATLLALTTVGLGAVTSADSNVDPTPASLTVVGWCVAVPLTALAITPALRLRTRRGSSAADTARATGGAGHSRRSVLHGMGLTMAMLGAAAVIPKEVLLAPGGLCKTDSPQCRPGCQAAYDRCVGANPGQKPCCIDCYVACQGDGRECTPGVSCSGAWHDPNSFGF